MLAGLTALLLAATLAGPPEGITCDTLDVRRKIGNHLYVLDTQVACYPGPPHDPELARLERLKSACDLLVTAYGKGAGRRRCRDLIRRLGADVDALAD